jgi:hypothetical protein
MVALGKIPTLDKLRKRKVIVMEWCIGVVYIKEIGNP